MTPARIIRRRVSWWRAFERAPSSHDVAALVFGESRKRKRVSRRWLYRKGKRIEVVVIGHSLQKVHRTRPSA